MPAQSSPERDHRSRPTSLITTPSTEAPVTPAVGVGCPFKTHQGLGLGPEIVTPSTTGTETDADAEAEAEASVVDSSLFSHGAIGHSDASSSPFTSVGSRASSLANDEKIPTNERGDSTTSKSSDETVHQGPQVVTAM